MKRIISTLLAAAVTLLLAVAAFADVIPGVATCTITPTETKVSGNTATVTYSIAVAPPAGKELGVFSVQLRPSEGMTLAADWLDASGSRIINYVDDLTYNKYSPDGIFATYEYTPQTGYFAAVGTTSDRRMSTAATILTIQATVPADKAGSYTLNAEFIAAPDGSGDVYTAQVITTPVTVSGKSDAPTVDNTPVITETPPGSAATGNTATGSAASNSVTPGSAAPDSDGSAADAPADMPALSDNGAPASAAPGSSGADDAAARVNSAASPLLLAAAVVVLLIAASFLLLRKKK